VSAPPAPRGQDEDAAKSKAGLVSAPSEEEVATLKDLNHRTLRTFGLPAAGVADTVFEAVAAKVFYISTHPDQFEAMVTDRFNNLLENKPGSRLPTPLGRDALVRAAQGFAEIDPGLLTDMVTSRVKDAQRMKAFKKETLARVEMEKAAKAKAKL
jgi:hypothetical protein